jgi:Heparinase II/III-like protein/Heparinase II/III N-terminus
MVPRLRCGAGPAGRERAKRLRKGAVNAVIAVTISVMFCLKLANYVDPAQLRPSVMAQEISVGTHNVVSAISNIPLLNRCPRGQRMYDVPGGYVCGRRAIRSVYEDIYATYPLVGSGREAIYSSTDEGSVQAADDLLRNQFDLPRYRPVSWAGLPTWSENPYRANYWRFEFYSLRPTLNLLYAFRTTGRRAYARRLLQLDSSFVAAEPTSRWAWVDPHAVAFRAMALVDTWWKLRQAHQLPEGTSTQLLSELEKTGQFLADPNHYQPGENHGTHEAAALFELAVAFPTLPHARDWLALAKDRIRWQLGSIIDADGQLIENAPYYDFYTLSKYWQIYNYSVAQNEPVAGDFRAKLASMVKFATYILQPDDAVPLLGASLETTIHDFGEYAGMAATSAQFRYVLTHGAQGSPPPVDSRYFRASALTVMRSGWGSGAAFGRSTYLTYNVGRYRTAHSDLDALGITLYAGGGDLLTDPGLYTYRPGPYHDYFHGTASHNTVTVDGKSQFEGAGTAGPLISKDGVTYQTAESSLYAGVTHRRLVMMIDPDHVLVVDRLSSASVHTYRQMFHLFPGARLTRAGLTVTGSGGHPRREVTIQQLLPAGLRETSVIGQRGQHPAGLCSRQYDRLLPCWSVSYSARQRNATFVTLLTVGPRRRAGFSIACAAHGQLVRIRDGQQRISVALGESAATEPRARATDPTPPPVKVVPVPQAIDPHAWAAGAGGQVSSGPAGRGPALVQLSAPGGAAGYARNDAVQLNLARRNARLRLRVTGVPKLAGLHLVLSNDHWARTETLNLLNSYSPGEAGHWADIFVGRSGWWGPGGGWQASGPGFDWSRVDGIEIVAVPRTAHGPAPTVSLAGLSLLPAQRAGKLAFVFDDGYQSILPAAQYLHRMKMPGNVAPLEADVAHPVQGYLNLYQLRALQDNWGWDIVNHTRTPMTSAVARVSRNHVSNYELSILNQAEWLQHNGLDSAPNWFIDPHDASSPALERMIGRYYMFDRVIADGPDSYPYGDPHAISDLEVQSPVPGAGGAGGLTRPAQVLAAVRAAAADHQTLILTFGRIHSQASDPPGYPMSLFRQVVAGVRRSGIKVMSLSQLDRSNGVPVRNRIRLTAGRPSMITVHLTATGHRYSSCLLPSWLGGNVLFPCR